MATREELEAREADCDTAQDFAALIKDAAEVDKDYAKELVDKAEMASQMPPDYVAAAEAAHAIGETDMAKNLFEQAEDMCFEPMEFAAVGAGLAATGLDKDKGAELLKQAADQASKLEEFLQISAYAKEALGDEELAASLLAKVEEKAKGLDDYLDLAKSVKATGNDEMARGFFDKAARYTSGLEDTVKYAQSMLDIFAEQGAAKGILEGAEGDCQFPKDFAELATGFKQMFDDNDKVAELMQQGADYAMSAEENLDLAQGYWSLMGDKEKAADAYAKALPELNDKAQLLGLAGLVAGEMDAKDLAKQMYAKAEGKMSGANELIKLAEAVIKDTGDKDYALEVYQRAGASLSQPNDLMNLGGNIVDQLGDKVTASPLYRKAFEALSDFGQYTKLLERVDEKLGDKEFGREILKTAAGVAQGTPEFLDLTERSMAVLGDQTFAKGHLDKAEEQVTSVGEMKNIVEMVKKHFADDADWVGLVEEKLARREANQAKYAIFQKREQNADSVIKLLHLSDQVMTELDDKFYAQKLLVEAQKKLDDEGWDLTKARMLIKGVGGHLGDMEWATKLLNDAAGRAQSFSSLRSVAEMAVQETADKEAARALVTGYLKDWEAKLDGAGAYDYSKLAAAVGELAGDGAWAKSLLDKAAQLGGDHFAFAQLASVAGKLGDTEAVKGFLNQAAAAVSDVNQAGQLARRLAASGFDAEQVREAYSAVKDKLGDGKQQLAWAEGVINIFNDQNWAAKAYAELSASMGGDPAFQLSSKIKLKRGV